MLNVIRATFRPNIGVAVGVAQVGAAAGAAVLENEKEKEKEITKETLRISGSVTRTSSATKGRGLQRARKNETAN